MDINFELYFFFVKTLSFSEAAELSLLSGGKSIKLQGKLKCKLFRNTKSKAYEKGNLYRHIEQALILLTKGYLRKESLAQVKLDRSQ